MEHMSKRQQAKAMLVIFALFLFAGSLPNFPFEWIWAVIFFAILLIGSEFLDVTLPQGSHVSVSSAFIIAMLSIMPFQPALATTGFGLLIATLLRERHVPWEEMFFSPAKNVVSLISAYAAYSIFKSIPAAYASWSSNIGGLVLAAIVFYAIDTLQDQLNLSYGTWRFLLRSYVSSWRLAGTTYAALACSGLLIAVTYSQIGYWGILLLCLPLFVIRYSFRLYINIKRTYQNTIEALASAIETQDPRRRGHAKRVAEYSIAIARELGIYGDELELIGYGALLHDIGKIGLEENEYEIAGTRFPDDDQHSKIGAEIVENIHYLPGVSKIVAGHHKKHLQMEEESKGKTLSLSSRIVGVASAYDNLVNMPTFGERLTPRDALKIIKKDQAYYDPGVTRALAEVLRRAGGLSFRF